MSKRIDFNDYLDKQPNGCWLWTKRFTHDGYAVAGTRYVHREVYEYYKGAGALRLLPVSRLYFSRPLAVSPAPLDTGSFSPRPTDSDTPFFAIISSFDVGMRVELFFRTHDNLYEDCRFALLLAE